MSVELPERKVLKEILAKLKAKDISSEENYKISCAYTVSSLQSLLQIFLKYLKENPNAPDYPLAERMAVVLKTLNDNVLSTISMSIRALDDKRVYTESLERYSSELDITLEEIFKQAEEKAKEQIKEMEKIREKKPPESMIA